MSLKSCVVKVYVTFSRISEVDTFLEIVLLSTEINYKMYIEIL